MKSRTKTVDTKPTAVTLSVVLEKPTAGVDFGLQKGQGSDCEVVSKERSKGDDLEFEFTVTAKTGRDDDLPNFAGPFVQGPAGGRFVYINIGTYAGQTSTPWSRRLKIPLSGITWDMLRSGKVLVARIPGTGKDGGPSCAYEWRKRVSPLWQWQLGERQNRER
jgi:uncharacterized protein DUF5990